MVLDLGAIGEDERVWKRKKVSNCERGKEKRERQMVFVEKKKIKNDDGS